MLKCCFCFRFVPAGGLSPFLPFLPTSKQKSSHRVTTHSHSPMSMGSYDHLPSGVAHAHLPLTPLKQKAEIVNLIRRMIHKVLLLIFYTHSMSVSCDFIMLTQSRLTTHAVKVSMSDTALPEALLMSVFKVIFDFYICLLC